MSDYYILEGPDHKLKEADLETKAQWLAKVKLNERIVGDETIEGVRVLTLFIGGSYREHAFETRIFGGPHDLEQWWSTTWDEAAAAHAHAIELVKGDSQ